jgi:hypothetical protein
MLPATLRLRQSPPAVGRGAGSKVGHPLLGPPASSALLPGPSAPTDRPTVDFGRGWALVYSMNRLAEGLVRYGDLPLCLLPDYGVHHGTNRPPCQASVQPNRLLLGQPGN